MKNYGICLMMIIQLCISCNISKPPTDFLLIYNQIGLNLFSEVWEVNRI
jgi:hypothetical protein